MRTEYRRDLQQSLLILSGEGAPAEEGYVVRMVRENRIRGLLPCRITRINAETVFTYDITSHVSLNTILRAQPARRELMYLLFSALSAVMEELDSYLLPPEGLQITPDKIFLDAGGREVFFCYYPETGKQLVPQMKELSRSILGRLDRKDQRAIVMAYAFYQKCEESDLTISDLRSLLGEGERDAEETPMQSANDEGYEPENDALSEKEEERSFFQKLLARVRTRFCRAGTRSEDPGETIACPPLRGQTYASAQPAFDTGLLLAKEDEAAYHTVLLHPAPSREEGVKAAKLVPEGGGEPILLDGRPALIGKKEAQAQIVLGSPAVSRMHAVIQRRDGRFELTDRNSRNGTWINGELLMPEQAAVLSDGDRICFADMDFRFEEGTQFEDSMS